MTKRLAGVLLLSVVVLTANAQDAPPAPPAAPKARPGADATAPGTAPAAPSDPPRPPLRDPTEPDARLRQVRPSLAGGVDSRPFQLPAITLKGLVVSRGKPGAAVIAVGQQLFRVQEGTTLTVTAGGSVLTIRIATLTQDELTIEVSPLGETLSVR